MNAKKSIVHMKPSKNLKQYSISNTLLNKYNKNMHVNSYAHGQASTNTATIDDFKKLRNRAYRKLKGKVPAGWKMRVSRKYKRSYMYSNMNSNIHNQSITGNYFITATKNLGKKNTEEYSVLKCLIHPSAGPTWSISNWNSKNNFHYAASKMLTIDMKELDQLFACMNALRYLMDEDPLLEIKGIAMATALLKWEN